MRFGRISRGAAIVSLAAGSWAAGSSLALAQQSKTVQKDAAKSSAVKEKERASGVIVKVDRREPNASAGKAKAAARDADAVFRVTINTNAVWRDWARDQSVKRDVGPAKKDAAKGEDSVATVGEPTDPNSLVVVVVGPDTPIRTRFRSPIDETSAGSKEPDGKASSSSKAAVQFHAGDLKAGLFVEVDFRHVATQDVASAVTVIRPVGGPVSGSADKPK